LDFDIYQRKSRHYDEEYENKFGSAASPFLRMIDEFSTEVKHLPFSLYFDNLFTS
jgi:hypothetical protein